MLQKKKKFKFIIIKNMIERFTLNRSCTWYYCRSVTPPGSRSWWYPPWAGPAFRSPGPLCSSLRSCSGPGRSSPGCPCPGWDWRTRRGRATPPGRSGPGASSVPEWWTGRFRRSGNCSPTPGWFPRWPGWAETWRGCSRCSGLYGAPL